MSLHYIPHPFLHRTKKKLGFKREGIFFFASFNFSFLSAKKMKRAREKQPGMNEREKGG